MFNFIGSPETRDYMKNGIKYVCENFKGRSPGSKSERDSQKYFNDELSKYADEVTMEDFTLKPHAFMGFIIIAAVLCLVSIGIYWLLPISPLANSVSVSGKVAVAVFALAPAFSLFSILMFLFEFLFYDEFVDFLFPKRASRNVYAVRKPLGETKKRIIFGGHADAAYEWTFSLHGQLKTLAPIMAGAIIGMFFIFGVTLAYFIYSCSLGFLAPTYDTIWRGFGIAMLCFIPFLVAIAFFINWKVVVDGANDNLSACYAAIGVLKEMSDNDFRFDNTEVCCFISGSEEAGLRGAKAFAKKHQQELKDVETVAITMDTMREIDQLQIYTKGCTGTVKDSEAVGDLLHEAGLKYEIDMPRAGLYPGAVDAEGFSKYGVKACGFCGVNHNPKTYYHTRKDTFDNINEECINLSLDICLEAARLYNKNGITHYEKKIFKENKKSGK